MNSGPFKFEQPLRDKTPETDETRLQGNPDDSFGGFGSFAGEGESEDDTHPFPVEMLPATLREMAGEISKVALVPESLAVMNVLGFVSSSIGGGLLIDSGGGRITPANLFLLGIAESGTGKGRAFSIASQAFAAIEAEEIDRWENEGLPEVKKDLRLIEKDLKRQEKALDQEGGSLGRDEIGREIQELERRKADLEKSLAVESGFSVADITKEKLAITMERQPGQALASLSPEGRGVIDVLMGKYGKGQESDEDLYLSAYSGEPVKVSRVGRSPVNLSTPCLAVLWLIQPDKARKLTESEAITESGLLPRFLICDSKAEVMDEPEEPDSMKERTLEKWGGLIRDLLETFRVSGDTPMTIRAAKEARRLIVGFRNESNARTRGDGDLRDITPFVARWAENAWRLALVLHAGEYGKQAGNHDLREDTARRAVEIVKWFSREQLAILASKRNDRNRKRLMRLLSVLADHRGKRTLRDLAKSHGFPKDEVQKLAGQFPAQIRIEKEQPEGGGRPSEALILATKQ